MSNYADYKRPEWQRKRLEILQRDGFTCVHCCMEGKTLHVHHHYYISKRNLWDYPNSAYITLCDECHKEVHESPDQWSTWECVMDFLSKHRVPFVPIETFSDAIYHHVFTPYKGSEKRIINYTKKSRASFISAFLEALK